MTQPENIHAAKMTRNTKGAGGAPKASEVAIVCQGNEAYGVGSVVKLYAEYMPEALFLCKIEGPLTNELRAAKRRVAVMGVGLSFMARGSLGTVGRLPKWYWEAGRAAKAILPIIRGEGIRIFHAPVLADYLIGGHLRKHDVKCVWHVHNNTNRKRLWGMGVRLNHLMAWWGADLVIGVSKFISSNWEGCGRPVVTVLNAAGPIHSGPSNPPGPPYRCLIAGRLEESKGHHHAVEAVIAARRGGIDATLDVFGGPLEGNGYADRLKARIKETGNEESIRLMGFVKDLRQRHQDYHLGLQCRIDPEPCSVWVCEAQVDGLPLLAAADGGTPELVEEGVTGCLYKAGDQNDISNKLAKMLRSPDALGAMRKAAFLRGQTLLNPKRMVEETLSAYAKIDQ